MEHDGVGDVEVDVDSLTDAELSQKLRQLGANIGPVTGTFYMSELFCTVLLLPVPFVFFRSFFGFVVILRFLATKVLQSEIISVVPVLTLALKPRLIYKQ